MYGSEQRTYIKVGAIALVAALLLLAGITIGRGVRIATAPVQVHVRAASAAGLEAGAPVWINGIKQGSVLSVRPDGDSVLIVAGLEDGSMLRADARAQIAMLEITGGKRLDILPGTSPTPWNGAVLRGEPQADVTMLIGQFGMLATDTRRLFERLDTTVGAANALLADGVVQAQLRHIVTQTSELVAELRQFVGEHSAALDRIVADVGATTAQLRDAVERNRPTVERLLERLDRASLQVETLAQKATHLATAADTTLTELNAMLSQLRTQRTVLGKLLYDERFASSLDTTFRRLGGVVDTISRYGINVNVRLGTRP